MATSILITLVALNIAPLGIALYAVCGTLLIAATLFFAVRHDVHKAITFALALLFSLLAALSFYITAETRYAAEEGNNTVIGRIAETCIFEEDGSLIFKLSDLVIGGNDVDGLMSVSIENGDDYSFLRCGYTVSLTDKIYHNQLVDGWEVNASGVRSGVRYNAYPEKLTVISPGSADGLEAVRLNVRNILTENMDEDTAAVAYGMLVGDRQYLPDTVSSSFSVSGIGHILAVSGLHIGVLAAALSFALRKMRVPRKIAPFCIIALLLAYAIFTGGSPSVVRATVMCTIMLLAPLFGKRDMLNSLAAAAVVCLTISPYYLFECGFIMSFSAVFGLATLTAPLTRLLIKMRLPLFLARAAAASFSAGIAVIPATAVFFHMFYTYSMIVNLLLLPLLSVMYIVLFFAAAVCLIIPVASPVLLVVGIPISWLCVGCSFVSSLPLASIIVHSSPVAFVSLPVIFAASDFVLIKKLRAVRSLLCLAALALLPLYADNTFRQKDVLVAFGNGDTVITGEVNTVIGEFTGNTVSRLFDARISSRVRLYVTDMTEDAAVGIIELSKVYDVESVTVYESTDISGIKLLLDNGLIVNTDAYDGYSAAQSDGKFVGWLYSSQKTVLVSTQNSGSNAEAVADVVRCRMVFTATTGTDYIASYASDSITNTVYTTTGRNILYDMATGTFSYS